MKTLKAASMFGLGILLMGAPLFVGCNDDDDSPTGSSINTALVGIWQHTETGVEQETIELQSNGNFNMTWADYENELCAEASGTWDAGDDSLSIQYTMLGTSYSDTGAFTLSGNTLTVTDEEGSWSYTKVTSMKSCDDYNFQNVGEFWTGSFSATAGGTALSLATYSTVDFSDGELTIMGSNGSSAVMLSLDGNTPGSYTINDNCYAGYLPNAGDYTNMYAGVSGTIVLSAYSATHVAGTFTFTGMNSSMETISVTNGSFDITAP